MHVLARDYSSSCNDVRLTIPRECIEKGEEREFLVLVKPEMVDDLGEQQVRVRACSMFDAAMKGAAQATLAFQKVEDYQQEHWKNEICVDLVVDKEFNTLSFIHFNPEKLLKELGLEDGKC